VTSPSESVRIAVVQLDDYGPWTVEPTPRRETDLQALQTRLYADFADFVGRSDGYSFFNRFDNMLGITNQIDLAEYERFQERIRNRYPITVSVGVGEAETPVRAVELASQQLQAAGSAQDPDRREVLSGANLSDSPGRMTVAHFDIVGVTESFTDAENAATADLVIQESMLVLKRQLQSEYDSISQFVGGDNMIAVCPSLSDGAFDDIVEYVHDQTGVEYQVGIGSGQTAHEAGWEAKEALEHCRERGLRVHRAGTPYQHATDD